MSAHSDAAWGDNKLKRAYSSPQNFVNSGSVRFVKLYKKLTKFPLLQTIFDKIKDLKNCHTLRK